MTLISRVSLPLLSALLLAVVGCSVSTDARDADGPDNSFKSFKILTEDNPGLTSSVTGNLDGNTVLLESPDTSVPSYSLIPRFDTAAVSVEVKGAAQQSGVTAQDFSAPVEYTLTDRAGRVSRISAELFLNKAWIDLGANPVQAAGQGINGLRCGLIDNSIPYVVSFSAGAILQAYRFDPFQGTWTHHNAGAPPSNIANFDSAARGNSLVVVYETNPGVLNADTTNTGNGWNGTLAVEAATAGTRDLQLIKGGNLTTLYCAWIEDPGVLDKVRLRRNTGGAVWDQLPAGGGSGKLDSYHVNDMAVVAGGGTDLWLVCTMDENPGVLHYFKYDFASDNWSDPLIDGAASANRDSGLQILEFFYDRERNRPVLFALYPISGGSSYELRALYWSDTAGVWTDLDSIQPLGLSSAAQLNGLSLAWNENRPSAVVGGQVYDWDGSWKKRGAAFDGFSPGASALIATIKDGTEYYIVSYTNNPAVDELRVKVRQ